MTIQFKVPSIACEVCANTITKAIQNQQADAQVTVDIANKIVTVETGASEEVIKKLIEGAGHNIA